GLIVASYIYGNDLISQNRGGAKSYCHVDGLGSTRALTNASGAVTDRYVYDAFGRTLGQMGSTVNVYLFAGEQRDSNVGLDYLRARYLSVGTGRFYGSDSFRGFQQKPESLHRYSYADGNPVANVDPSGLVTLAELTATTTIQGILRTANAVVRFVAPIQSALRQASAFETASVFGAVAVLIPFALATNNSTVEVTYLSYESHLSPFFGKVDLGTKIVPSGQSNCGERVLTLAIGFPKYDAGKGQSVSGDIKFGYNLDRSEFSIDSTVNFGIRYERRVFGAFVASLELSTPISAGSGGMSL